MESLEDVHDLRLAQAVEPGDRGSVLSGQELEDRNRGTHGEGRQTQDEQDSRRVQDRRERWCDRPRFLFPRTGIFRTI